jgi:hypothetical protein
MAVSCLEAANEVLRVVASAAAAGETARAAGALASLERPLPAAVVRQAASHFMRHQHWSDALDLLLADGDLADASIALQTCLARNMVALRRHRPEVYDAIHRVPARSQCQITRVDGGLSIGQTLPGKPTFIHCGAVGPAGQLQRSTAALADHQRQCLALALAGISDGHLLHWLAHHPPHSALGMQQAIYLVEPFPELVAHVLMLHDWSGPASPICDPRFHWFVGPGAAQRLGDAWLADPWLSRPRRIAAQGIDSAALSQAIQQEVRRADARDLDRRLAVHARYAAMPASHWVDRLGPSPSATPRALVVTSRFTTVLQYSARDLADALERLGYQVLFILEPAPWQRLDIASILDAVDRFTPDVMFALDHLRYELGDLLPPELCHICWVQDDLPNLTSVEAGRSLGPRDFVLTWEKARYSEVFGYPAQRCVYMSKLTRVPQRPARWRSDGDDLVYVSNASGRIDDLEASVLRRVGNDPGAARVAAEACRRLRAVYEQGGSLCSLPQLRALVRQTAAELGLRSDTPEGMEWLVHRLEHPLNNALYRQQALGWVVEAASARGLSVALYGSGWEQHPRFAPFARGPVAYGPQLEQLTRASRINLQIVPFNCLHQRLLDGLVAGGFFLVRHHPLDVLAPRWFELVRSLDPGIRSVQDARRSLPPATLAAVLDLIAQLGEHDDRHSYDPIAAVRDALAEGLGDQFRAMPRLAEVSFDSAAALRAAIDRFLDDEPARQAIADEQRAFVEAHFTYDAGMGRALRAIHRHLAGACA